MTERDEQGRFAASGRKLSPMNARILNAVRPEPQTDDHPPEADTPKVGGINAGGGRAEPTLPAPDMNGLILEAARRQRAGDA